MHFKILKKIVGIFGFKLTSKNLVKVERILASNDSLSMDRILINIFNTKKMTGLIQIGANDGLRFDNINKHIKKYKPKSILVEPIKEYFNEAFLAQGHCVLRYLYSIGALSMLQWPHFCRTHSHILHDHPLCS